MKKQIFIIVALISLGKSFSQNKYSEYSTSTYKPMSTGYYEQQAELKGDRINELVNTLSERVSENLNQNIDEQFRRDLSEVNSYLALLRGDEEMSIAEAEGYANKARKLYNRAIKNYNKRIKNSNKEIKLKISEANNFWNNGVELYRKKDYQNAIIIFSKYLEIDPYATDALFFRALAKSEINDRYGAISDYDKILSQEGRATPNYYKFSTVYNNKAYCLVELGNYTDALPLVNKALELDKTEAYIWDTRGELNYKIGKYENCIADMDNAILIQESGNSFYYRGLAKIKIDLKERGCVDLSKSNELGSSEAMKEIEEFCK